MDVIHVFQVEGGFVAFDGMTGANGCGETRSSALQSLVVSLDSREHERNTAERFEKLSDEVQQRAEENDVTEEIVEEAIDWARRR
jgi:hypothetical protein